MEAIRETVKNVIQGLVVKKGKTDVAYPEQVLKKILTKKEMGHIKFNYFKKGVLSINVDSSAWLYKLTLQKQDLLSRLKKKTELVKDIHFRIGDIR